MGCMWEDVGALRIDFDANHKVTRSLSTISHSTTNFPSISQLRRRIYPPNVLDS